MKTIIVWFRNDLRVHDNPALFYASKDADLILPVFILDKTLLSSSANRTRFLLESLKDLKASLKKLGADLLIRKGESKDQLERLVKEYSANAVYYSADYTPYALKRDKNVKKALEILNVEIRGFPGRLAVANLDNLSTKAGTPHKVFTPFWKQWQTLVRRNLGDIPKNLKLPSKVSLGKLPALSSLVNKNDLSPNVCNGGESQARKALEKFLDNDISSYHQGNNDMAEDSTSRLSPYLQFGCISPREIETMLPDNQGARAWHRQLAWREFYNYILFMNPHPESEFQEKYRNLKWDDDKKLLDAWQNGQTGYPAVDAAMRQMISEGWMHNRARLIVGSFLTKDLWLDWRLGEAYFMKLLLDGDKANNNGNWQWIASVGVDPAPVYRRLYNPSTQRDKFDPTGAYVRKYVPELKNVPNKYLSRPWEMDKQTQEKAKCIIGKDYPGPIVDHKAAREAALANYRSVLD
jgi:deoxyribodipyrimidine photo-lyase